MTSADVQNHLDTVAADSANDDGWEGWSPSERAAVADDLAHPERLVRRSLSPI
jgi:hypothetical protein